VATAQRSEVVTLAVPRRSVARAALVALRPRQWSKNLLVFAGIVFGAKLGDPVRWIEAAGAFVAYCAASSAAYLANDVRDADDDRHHPVKQNRPVARGELPARAALVLAGGLSALALATAAALGIGSVLLLVGFLAVQVAYTLRLKHVVLIDVMAIGALFVIRAAAGAEAVDVRISPWLLICTALLALFLALAKRRGELVLVGAEAVPSRPVLEGYSLELVDQLVSVVAASTVIAYALYTLESPGGDAMMATIPFVLFGVFRYLLLVHRHDLGEEPERVLLTDRPIILTVLGWALVSAVILAVA
jgi:4-hydroxybenzoate polyprenyltransferase